MSPGARTASAVASYGSLAPPHPQDQSLYVAKLDRLTRRGMGHVGLILDELEKVSGRIVFVADGLDTSEPGARPVIAILAEQARAESDNTSWRVGQWHLHNRRHGVWNQQRPLWICR